MKAAVLVLLGFYSLTCVAVERDRPFHTYDDTVSVARNWNEALLSSISRDFARPTVHARNLYHAGIAIYDSWAFFDESANTFLLGRKTALGVDCSLTAEQAASIRSASLDIAGARKELMSYAMYRFMLNRFRLMDESELFVQEAPGFPEIAAGAEAMMLAMGFDPANTSLDLSTGSPAALGNYLAECLLAFGRADGANEQEAYSNLAYTPVNPPLNPANAGVGEVVDPSRWQPLMLDVTVDQAGNRTSTPPFLGANWGVVDTFALSPNDRTVYQRGGQDFPVYLDPGSPPRIQSEAADYRWHHSLVVAWSAHLANEDGVQVDISPGNVGNTGYWPNSLEELKQFYGAAGAVEGGGRSLNPKTGSPYPAQMVPRGDYTRVLAEFWADGPDSLTPPGHWFRILNEAVLDHSDFSPRLLGVGPEVERLEWEAKTYFVLGAAMHDAAVVAWGLKGWYDYVRPITAIRYMVSKGQSSDPSLASYHPDGIALLDGAVELVTEGDALAGENGENIGKIKVFAWRGPDFIEFDVEDPTVQRAINHAGVGWILGEHWWPYQRPTFVTPPFAGYVSGHSTFSQAAAEVLTAMTGDEYFPGGLAEFVAKKDEFLVFEKGPSVDVRLQWATYRDAADQCSLSRIWGGIHPPADDIPGRRLGAQVAERAIAAADDYFSGRKPLEVSGEVASVQKKKRGGALDLSVLILGLGLLLKAISTSYCRRAQRRL